jgi:hypothetical protein
VTAHCFLNNTNEYRDLEAYGHDEATSVRYGSNKPAPYSGYIQKSASKLPRLLL